MRFLRVLGDVRPVRRLPLSRVLVSRADLIDKRFVVHIYHGAASGSILAGFYLDTVDNAWVCFVLFPCRREIRAVFLSFYLLWG